MAPPIRHHSISNELHRPKLLLDIFNNGRVPKERGRAVVVVVGVGRQGQHDARDDRGADADWETGGGGLRGQGREPGGGVGVEVEV